MRGHLWQAIVRNEAKLDHNVFFRMLFFFLLCGLDLYNLGSIICEVSFVYCVCLSQELWLECSRSWVFSAHNESVFPKSAEPALTLHWHVAENAATYIQTGTGQYSCLERSPFVFLSLVRSGVLSRLQVVPSHPYINPYAHTRRVDLFWPNNIIS